MHPFGRPPGGSGGGHSDGVTIEGDGSLATPFAVIPGVFDPAGAAAAALVSAEAYTDSAIAGVAPKPSARFAPIRALPAYTISGGGSTMTMNATGALAAQDGVTAALNDIFFYDKDAQHGGVDNGLWQITTLGAPGVAMVATRITQLAVGSHAKGAFFTVFRGDTRQGEERLCTNDTGSDTVGTHALTFKNMSIMPHLGVFNVMDYGAIADCVIDNVGNVVSGTDNTAAFQAAITALQTVKHGKIYIPAGKYLCTTGNLIIAAESFIFFGDGEASQIIVDCGFNRWITINSPGAFQIQDLAFLGNNVNATNCSTVFFHNNCEMALYQRLGFYGIGAASNLINWLNASIMVRDVFVGGCFISDMATLTNGFIGCIGTGQGMDVENYESIDFGTINGVGYSRGSGGALCSINLGDIFSGSAPDYGQTDIMRTGAYLFKNLRIDEGAQSAIFGHPSAGRYQRIEINGLNYNQSGNANGGISIVSADAVEIKNSYWGLHGGNPFIAVKLVDAGDVIIRDSHAVTGYLFEVDALTKSLKIINTVYSGILFDTTAPRVTEEIDGVIYTILQAATAFSANLFVIPAASGKVDAASVSNVAADIRGISTQAPAFSIGSATALPKAQLHNASYIDMPTVNGQAMRIEFDNGAPVNPAEVHFDYSGVGATAINVATAFVAAFNGFALRQYNASNVGGTSAVITFTAIALGSQYDGQLGGSIFFLGPDAWTKVNPVGGLANVRILEQWGQITSLKTDANYAIGDYIKPSTANAGQGLKATTGDFCGLVVAPTSGGLTSVVFGKYTGVFTDNSTLPTLGTAVAAAGNSLLAAPQNHIHPRERWTPGDHNLLSWSFDPVVAVNSTAMPTAGLLNLARIHLSTPQTITNLILHMATAGGTLTSGQCFAALFTAAGANVAVTADQASNWGSSPGLKTMALAVAYVAAAGDYYVGFWFNGTTGPAFNRGSGQAALHNAGLAAPNLRFCTADSGLTTTPPTNLGSQTAVNTSWWVAVS